jgi:4-aminobutyrate aminotransferase-like enzyme
MDAERPPAEERAELRELIRHIWPDFAQAKTDYDDPFILDRGAEERKLESAHTFDANPLSAAAGHAVLSYILEHRLVDNARQVGAYLVERARAIANAYECVTQVMGAGLWVTMFIARDPRTGAFAPHGQQFGRALHVAGRRNGLLLRP